MTSSVLKAMKGVKINQESLHECNSRDKMLREWKRALAPPSKQRYMFEVFANWIRQKILGINLLIFSVCWH